MHQGRRIAHAVRGLKSFLAQTPAGAFTSHRSRGAWIEIRVNQHRDIVRQVASLTRCVY